MHSRIFCELFFEVEKFLMKVEFALGIRARMGSDFGARSAPKAERTFWAAKTPKMITPEPDRTCAGMPEKG